MLKKNYLYIFTFLFLMACSVFQTGTPTLTKVLDSKVVTAIPTPDLTFNEENINKTPPDDLIQEIAYFGGAGGGGPIKCSDTEAGNATHPTFMFNYDDGASLEVYSPGHIGICGIPGEEKVEVEVKMPDGSEHHYQITSTKQYFGEKYEAFFDYIPDLRDPLGDHILTFSGAGWTLQTTMHIADATSARLYFVDNKKIIFYKFQPNEKVRLLVYQPVSTDHDVHDRQRLVGWKEYQMGQDGELTVDVEMEGTLRFIAAGERTGQVVYHPPQDDGDYYYWVLVSRSDFYCPGAPDPIGLTPYGYAVVESQNLPLYSINWSSDHYPIEYTLGDQRGTLPRSTVVHLISNPICVNQAWWWDVECKDIQCAGYIREGETGKAYLKPVQEIAGSSTPETNSSFTCPGAPKTRIKTGITARVTYTDGTPVRLRKNPGFSSKVINKLPEGTRFKVFDGPQCLEETIWWKIELRDGLDGWIAEGDLNSYFIEPYN